MSTVTVSITNGPSIDVEWFQDMNTQQALEGAFNQQSSSDAFSFAIQYYGSSLGYLVIMIDNIYETNSSPIFYWEFYLNGNASVNGIDSTTLNASDKVTFTYEEYSEDKHKNTTVGVKHKLKLN